MSTWEAILQNKTNSDMEDIAMFKLLVRSLRAGSYQAGDYQTFVQH